MEKKHIERYDAEEIVKRMSNRPQFWGKAATVSIDPIRGTLAGIEVVGPTVEIEISRDDDVRTILTKVNDAIDAWKMPKPVRLYGVSYIGVGMEWADELWYKSEASARKAMDKLSESYEGVSYEGPRDFYLESPENVHDGIDGDELVHQCGEWGEEDEDV